MRSGGGRRRNDRTGRSRVDKKLPQTGVSKVVSRSSMDGFIGENAVFHLKLKHGFSFFASDGSGLAAISGYFSPDSLPGWASFGTLFKYFKPIRAVLNINQFKGTDDSGVFSVRVSTDPNDAIEATLAEEVERGAKVYTLSQIPREGIDIDLLSVGPDLDSTVSEWKEWHGTTPFGDAKEYGQIFIRGSQLTISSNFLRVFTKTEISFKSLLNI